MANVTSVIKFFTTAQEGFTTTTSGSVSSGAATVGLNGVTGYNNGEVVTLVIDPTDANKKEVFTGTVDTAGSQITGVKWTEGTNQAHTAGATVVDYETATAWAMYRKGLLVAHNEDGTLKDNSVSNASMLGTGVVNSKKLNNTWVVPVSGQQNIGTSFVNLASKSFILPEVARVHVIWTGGGNANANGDPGIELLIDGVSVGSMVGAGGLELLATNLHYDMSFCLSGLSGSLGTGSHTLVARANHSVASGWDVSNGGYVLITAVEPSHVL